MTNLRRQFFIGAFGHHRTGDDGSEQLGDISWLTPDGTQMTEPDGGRAAETVMLTSRSLRLLRSA